MHAIALHRSFIALAISSWDETVPDKVTTPSEVSTFDAERGEAGHEFGFDDRPNGVGICPSLDFRVCRIYAQKHLQVRRNR